MEQYKMMILENARLETFPEIPKKIRFRAKFFGRQILEKYIWDYYERESGNRIPYYLPYIYMKEHFAYLRRYGEIPRHQISMVLIDGNDERTDYFLGEFLQELNYLTIVTDRKEYFEGLQERAFQELGLLIDLARTWELKNLQGNLVWDFTKEMQPSDCYPKGSICFVPHKKEWKVRDLLRNCPEITTVNLKNVEIKNWCIPLNLAETLLVPKRFPFRRSRCEELQGWCKEQGWNIRLKAQNKAERLENP